MYVVLRLGLSQPESIKYIESLACKQNKICFCLFVFIFPHICQLNSLFPHGIPIFPSMDILVTKKCTNWMQFLQVTSAVWPGAKCFRVCQQTPALTDPSWPFELPNFPSLLKISGQTAAVSTGRTTCNATLMGNLQQSLEERFCTLKKKSIHRFCSSLTLSLLNQAAKNTFGDRCQNLKCAHRQKSQGQTGSTLKPVSIFRSACKCL